MSALTKLLAAFSQLSASELSAEVDDFERERRELVRAHDGKTRDHAHDALDSSRVEVRRQLESLTKNAVAERGQIPLEPSLGTFSHLEGLQAYLLSSADGYWEQLHSAVDQAGEDLYAPLSRPQYAKKLQQLDKAISERRLELERRELARRREAIDAEQSALENQLAAKAASGREQ